MYDWLVIYGLGLAADGVAKELATAFLTAFLFADILTAKQALVQKTVVLGLYNQEEAKAAFFVQASGRESLQAQRRGSTDDSI